MKEVAPAAVQQWAVSRGIIQTGSKVCLQNGFRGAGLVFLTAEQLDGSSILFVLACPAWYWGNLPEITCLFPPEAASVVKELRDTDGSALPHVAPDAVMQNGMDRDGQHKADLRRVSAVLCSEA